MLHMPAHPHLDALLTVVALAHARFHCSQLLLKLCNTHRQQHSIDFSCCRTWPSSHADSMMGAGQQGTGNQCARLRADVAGMVCNRGGERLLERPDITHKISTLPKVLAWRFILYSTILPPCHQKLYTPHHATPTTAHPPTPISATQRPKDARHATQNQPSAHAPSLLEKTSKLRTLRSPRSPPPPPPSPSTAPLPIPPAAAIPGLNPASAPAAVGLAPGSPTPGLTPVIPAGLDPRMPVAGLAKPSAPAAGLGFSGECWSA